MNKAEAWRVFATVIVKELLSDDDTAPAAAATATVTDEDPNPTPDLDQDVSAYVCEHGGIYFPRLHCPVHGPQQYDAPPTAEDLDQATGEETAEIPTPIARAARIAEQRRQAEQKGKLFPEELGLRNMSPPEE